MKTKQSFLNRAVSARNLVSAILPACSLAFMLGTASADVPSASEFELDPTGAKSAKLGYMPIQVKLMDEKPAGIKKEPKYAGTPKYGVFKVGNGPKAEHYLAVDEPKDGDWKIYVDLKGDGDLTSSGDGAWKSKREGERPMYGVNSYLVRASYGTADKETSSSDYGVAFYRFVGQDYLLMYREAVRKGTVTIDGKTHKALLAENDADGLFAKPVKDDGKTVSGKTTRPVWLLIDMEDDGKWNPPINASGVFKLGEEKYVADIAEDGKAVKFEKTTRDLPKGPPPPKPLLKVGTAAPDFEAEAWGGGTVKLSDFKGKVVLIDFWATWCGPCMKAMPHVEELYQATKGQDIVVLGLCVWDSKSAYEKWVPEKKDDYHFKFAFDPAGRDNAKSIASLKYNVNGIPTKYVIDKEGNIAYSEVGYSEKGEELNKALAKLGIKTEDTAKN